MTILKEYRINNDMVQKEMADKLGCSIPAYRNYESGKRTIPHDVLLKFFKLRAYPEDLRLAKTLEEIQKWKKENIIKMIVMENF